MFDETCADGGGGVVGLSVCGGVRRMGSAVVVVVIRCGGADCVYGSGGDDPLASDALADVCEMSSSLYFHGSRVYTIKEIQSKPVVRPGESTRGRC